MKLAHRIAPFQYLTPADPVEYGFDSMQVSIDPFSETCGADAKAWLDGLFFDARRMNIVLAINPGMDSPYFNADISNVYATPLANSIITALEGAIYHLRSSGYLITGIRWNHEHRFTSFLEGKAFDDWLKKTYYAPDWQYYYVAQRTRWNEVVKAIGNGTIGVVQFTEKTTGTFYDGSAYDNMRTLMGKRIAYVNNYTAQVISRLEWWCRNKASMAFYLYPGNVSILSPRILPQLEYSLNMATINSLGAMPICEYGSWSSATPVWISSSEATGGRPFFWTCQLDLRSSPAELGGEHYKLRMETAGSNGHLSGYGLWTDWTPQSPYLVTVDEMQSYFNGLASAMRA